MSLYHSSNGVDLYVGNVLDVLPTLESESVNCVVTSPPYFGLRDYGVDGQIGLEATQAQYVDNLAAVFAEVRRVLRKDGTLWLNLGDSYTGSWGNQGRRAQRGTQRPINGPMLQRVDDGRYPTKGTRTGARRPDEPPAKNLRGIPWRVAFALQDDGWTLRNEIIWHKTNAMPHSVTDRLTNRHEHIFLFTKSRRYAFELDPIREPHAEVSVARAGRARLTAYAAPGQTPNKRKETVPNALGRNPGDVWSFGTSGYKGAHFATFPPELPRRCILSGCPADGVVLDPFAGSGTTLMVAQQLGRRAIGIELNAEYASLAVQRIGEGAA